MTVLQRDLLVVGWDLTSEREVHVEDEPVEYWRSKSYRRGDGSLVCLYCYRGYDASPGTKAQLVVKAAQGGMMRPHFAHRPGQAPLGRHSPETVWHISTKLAVKRWALGQPHVVDVFTERWTDDGRRRSDVLVVFADGSKVAIEVQYRLLHDQDWLHRHRDYAEAGISDVWLWRLGQPRLPWIVTSAQQPIWLFDLDANSVHGFAGQARQRAVGWYRSAEIDQFTERFPAQAGDVLAACEWKLADLTVDPSGVSPPEGFLRDLDERRKAAHAEAGRLRAEDEAHVRAFSLRPLANPGMPPPAVAPNRPMGLPLPPERNWSAAGYQARARPSPPPLPIMLGVHIPHGPRCKTCRGMIVPGMSSSLDIHDYCAARRGDFVQLTLP